MTSRSVWGSEAFGVGVPGLQPQGFRGLRIWGPKGWDRGFEPRDSNIQERRLRRAPKAAKPHTLMGFRAPAQAARHQLLSVSVQP